MNKSFLRIAHRGRPGNPRYGENTIKSFEDAYLAGADAIEYDVRRTKDGTLVVFHDDTLLRTTGAPGLVADWTYEELSKFNAGYGESIPLFVDVLRRFSTRDVIQNIELKEEGLAEEVLELIMRYGLQNRVLVSAFDVRDDPDGSDGTVTWDDLSIFAPAGIPIALLAGAEKIQAMGQQAFIAEAMTRRATAVNPPLEGATSSLVAHAHGWGLKVYVWTVNEPEDIKRMKEIGVDGLFCDFVERLA